MPKRSREVDDDEDYITRKMKKLERKLMRKLNRRRGRPPADTETVSGDEAGISNEESEPASHMRSPPPARSPTPVGDDPVPETPVHVPDPPPLPQATTPDQPTSDVPENTTSADEIAEILGEDPSQEKKFGPEIKTELTTRFKHMLTEGIDKETRKELMEKYLPPENCPLIDAPGLNLEIKAALSEALIKKDKQIEINQKQIGTGITVIARALTSLLAEKNKNVDIIKTLNDGARVLCDVQHKISTTRKNFIMSSLKKDLKDHLQDTKIDKDLFGQNLAEKLKAAKAINKSGADLKGGPATTLPAANINANRKKITRPLNGRAPPSRRPMGNTRSFQPAPDKRRAQPYQQKRHFQQRK